MGIIESEADAIAWVHQMAKTPTPGDHEVTDPHPYCLGDDPCCCVQLIAAEQTARADEREKAAGRVRVETLREARAEVEAEAIHPWPDPNWFDMGYIAGHQDQLRDALAAIDRLINAETTGDTDD